MWRRQQQQEEKGGGGAGRGEQGGRQGEVVVEMQVQEHKVEQEPLKQNMNTKSTTRTAYYKDNKKKRECQSF